MDITGRIIRNDKVGYVNHQQQPILQRLDISDEQLLTLTTVFEKHFCYVMGAETMMKQFKEHPGHRRIRGIGKQKRFCASHNLNQTIEQPVNP